MREDPAGIDSWARERGLWFALVRRDWPEGNRYSPMDVYLRRPGSGWRLECESESAVFYRRLSPEETRPTP